MCIICVSPAGVRQPSFKTICTMFRNNPHGAGYMFARDGKVHISKGYMDIDSFLEAMRCEHFTKKDAVVYHFRISTQAGVNPQMTHPFPLSNQLEYMKALELYQSRYEKYVKKQGEDLSSILSGITSFKGNVHLSFCPMITEDDLRQFDSLTSIEYNREVARLMDERIFSGYKLTPNNFIAHDIRFGKHEFLGAKYSEEQKERFVFHMSKLDKYDVEEPEILRDIFLGIYSNPVDNCYMI